jgi:hypothetical protein
MRLEGWPRTKAFIVAILRDALAARGLIRMRSQGFTNSEVEANTVFESLLRSWEPAFVNDLIDASAVVRCATEYANVSHPWQF